MYILFKVKCVHSNQFLNWTTPLHFVPGNGNRRMIYLKMLTIIFCSFFKEKCPFLFWLVKNCTKMKAKMCSSHICCRSIAMLTAAISWACIVRLPKPPGLLKWGGDLVRFSNSLGLGLKLGWDQPESHISLSTLEIRDQNLLFWLSSMPGTRFSIPLASKSKWVCWLVGWRTWLYRLAVFGLSLGHISFWSVI